MTASDNLIFHFTFILAVNVLFLLAQAAIYDLEPGSASFYECHSGIFALVESQGCVNNSMVLSTNSTTSNLPGLNERASADQSTIWTDIFDSIKTWISAGFGFSWLLQILGAPVNFLIAIHAPLIVVFAMGAFWYLYLFFIILVFLWGR